MGIARILRIIFAKAGALFCVIGRLFYSSPEEKRVIPWFKVQGDKTLRLDYPLGENSLVLDLGGYEGQWASDIFSKYCCRIHIFEPVPTFADNIDKRFASNPKITIHKSGLGGESRDEQLSISADGSSMFAKGHDTVTIRIEKAGDFFRDNGIQFVDLMKINIEGGEYELLEHLIETGYIVNIRDIQVQFHEFVPGAEERMQAIQRQLEKTHHLTYQYPFVWENWTRN